MTIFRRRRSRIQRVKQGASALRGRLPSKPAMGSFEVPQVSLPARPTLPKSPKLNVRKRVSRDRSGDTPLLSLAGGLLLGLFVGIVVAVILISRGDNEDAWHARHTGITLLPHQNEDEAAGDTSAAGTG